MSGTGRDWRGGDTNNIATDSRACVRVATPGEARTVLGCVDAWYDGCIRDSGLCLGRGLMLARHKGSQGKWVRWGGEAEESKGSIHAGLLVLFREVGRWGGRWQGGLVSHGFGLVWFGLLGSRYR